MNRPTLVFVWKSSSADCRIHIANGLNTYCNVPNRILKLIDMVSEKYPASRRICKCCKWARIREDNKCAADKKAALDNGDIKGA